MQNQLRYRDIPEMLARIVWKGFTSIPPVAILMEIKKGIEMRKKKILMMNMLITEAKKGNTQAQFMLAMFQGAMSRECNCGCEQCNCEEDHSFRDEPNYTC